MLQGRSLSQGVQNEFRFTLHRCKSTRLLAFFKFCCALALVLPIAFEAWAQVYDGNQNLPPYGGFSGGDFDTVALQNGNLHLHIPIASWQQRGGKTLWLALIADTASWTSQTTISVQNGVTYYYTTWIASTLPGFTKSTNYGSYQLTSPISTYNCPGVGNVALYNTWVLTDPEGVQRPVPGLSTTAPACPYGIKTESPTADGSGIMVNIGSNPAIMLKDGTNIPLQGSGYNFFAESEHDTNGNLINTTDTVNRTTWTTSYGPTVTLTSPLGVKQQAPQYMLITVNDSSGTARNYQIDYTLIDIATSWCGYVHNPPISTCSELDNGVAWTVPKDLVLPNGASYQFSWNDQTPAELGSITLPTGGTISYTYTPGCLRANNTGRVPPLICREEITGRTVTVNGTSSSWSYSGVTSNPVTVTDPLNNQQTHTFSSVTVNGVQSTNGVETQVNYYQGAASGTPLKQVVTAYTGDTIAPACCTTYLGNLRPTSVTTTLANGLVSQTQTQYESTSGCSTCSNNPTAFLEYDYGAGAPGPLRRQTTYAYGLNSNPAYTNLNIVDRVTQKTVYDGNNNQIAQTTYEYDIYSHPKQPMVTSGAIQHTSSFNTSYTTRGNVTAVSQLNKTNGTLLTTTNQYDDAGNVISTIDPLGNMTSFSFSDAWSNTTCAPSGESMAFLTSSTNALNQITSYTYDSCTGLEASTKDPNLQSTSQSTSQSYDMLGRVTGISYPDGGSTSYCYTDAGGATCTKSSPPFSEVITQAISSSLNKTSTIVFDGLGRPTQTQLNSDPSGVTYTQTNYDLLGRPSVVYNPTRCSPPTTNCNTETTWGSTTYNYDGIGRTTSVTEQDGSIAQTKYDQTNPNSTGTCTTIIDEAGNARQSCADGLGRITGVWEDPGSSPHLNYETDYAYDTLDDLTTVTQKGGASSTSWRTRTFTYDSLSRLLCAANPEVQPVTCPASATGTFPAGAITYTYDNDSNLLTITAPSPNQSSSSVTVATTYTYDALNRMTGISYKDSYKSNPVTPSVNYGYDGVAPSGCTPPTVVSPTNSGIPVTPANTIGRRSSMCDGSGSTAWVYDSMGRPTIEERKLNSVTKNIGYIYYLDGNQKYLWYPSDNRMNFNVSAAGRTIGVTDEIENYVFGNAIFAPNGALTQMTQYSRSGSYSVGFGTVYLYNQRLQRAGEYASYNDTFLYKRCYDFHLKGGMNISYSSNLTCTFTGTTPGDNGNVYELQNKLDDTRSQNFVYDSLNRIQQAYSNGSVWGQQLNIDAWGNLYSATAVSGKPLVGGFSSTTPVPVSNHLSNSAYTYDAAGNMTSNGNGGITYDAEGHVITAGGVTYTYDGDGKRVEKSNGTLYWTGVGSDALSESDLSGNISEEYVFFNGKRVSRRDVASNTVHSFLVDHLGSSRMIVVASGTNTLTTEQDADYSPYGIVAYGTASDHYQFTGKERDNESMLDNFGARHYSSSIGRFMVPDPAGLAAQDPGNPQSWNLYAYVLNNPLNAIDPTGLYCVYLKDDGEHVESVDENGVFNKPVPTQAQAAAKDECGANGGYWIEGEYGGGSRVNVNSDAGTVTGVGYDSNGNAELSIAGAMGSNVWGAWTQTFSATATAAYLAPAPSNGALSHAWNFAKALIRGPSTGSGSCVGLFTDTVSAPMRQIRKAAKDFVPLIVSAMQAGPSGAAMYMQQLNNMVASGAAEADPEVAAVVTTAGTAAATAAPYVSAAAPYVGPAGADLVFAYGLGKELKAGANGQCRW